MDELKRQLALGLDRLSEWLTPEPSSGSLANPSNAEKADILYRSGVQAYNESNFANAESYLNKFLDEWKSIATPDALNSSYRVLALSAYYQEDNRKASKFAELSWESAMIQRDHLTRSRSAIVLGYIAYEQGHFDVARERAQYSREVYRILNDDFNMARSLSLLGSIEFQTGDHELARDHFHHALSLYQKIDHQGGQAGILNSLGYFVVPGSTYAEEKRYLTQALAMYRELEMKDGISCVVDNLGTIARYEGDLEAARMRYKMSLKMKREFGKRLYVAHSLEGMAVLDVAAGKAPKSARLIGAASEWREAADAPVQGHRLAEYEATIALACSQIGQQEFITECAAGRKMSVDEAVDLALRE